jgi:hypothetical protein
MGRACTTNGEEENASQLLMGKSERRRPRCRWLDYVKMDGSFERSKEPLGSINCWKVLEWLHNWWLLM